MVLPYIRTKISLLRPFKKLNCLDDLVYITTQRRLNTIILTNFENLNFMSNTFQKTCDFLYLTDPLIICIYLRTTGRHFRDKGNVRHPTAKLLKFDLVQTLNNFWNPSFQFFAAGKVSLVFFNMSMTSTNAKLIPLKCGIFFSLKCLIINCFKNVII